MIRMACPKVSETVYNGAFGSVGVSLRGARLSTGGQAEHLRSGNPPAPYFYGKEKKSLAYIIGLMNLILHGIEAPNIVLYEQRWRKIIDDIREKDRFGTCVGQSAFRRKGAEGGAAKLPDQDGRARFPLPSALQ